MEKTITTAEAIQLELELKDILSKKLDFGSKYHLLNLNKEITGQIESFRKVQQDVFKEFGTNDGTGNFIVKYFTDDTRTAITSEGRLIDAALNDVLKSNFNVKYTPIKFHKIQDIETEMVYLVLPEFLEFPEN